jgi:hypothetical protein
MSKSAVSALQSLLDAAHRCYQSHDPRYPGVTEDELRPLIPLYETACSLSQAANLKDPPSLEEMGLPVIELFPHWGRPDIPSPYRTKRSAPSHVWEEWQAKLRGLIDAARVVEGTEDENEDPPNQCALYFDREASTGQKCLWLDNQEIRRFRRSAPNQEKILEAFQKEEWPKDGIQSPIKTPSRLKDTLNNLNKGSNYKVRFYRHEGTWILRYEILP